MSTLVPCYARLMPDGSLEGRRLSGEDWKPLFTDKSTVCRLRELFKDSPATVKKLTASKMLNGEWAILIEDTELLP